MKRTLSAIALLLLGALVSACAATRVIVSEVSTPAVQTLERPLYDIRLKPVKETADFFTLFELTVKNKSPGNLEIDWNLTRYVFNNVRYSGFVWKGMTPSAIKEGTIPADVVGPGETLSKMIAPHRLVAWTPLRDTAVPIGENGIAAGPMPAGSNGIFLVFRQDGNEIQESLAVDIKVTKTQ